jgi:SNF2 family DNA or RNA helicase
MTALFKHQLFGISELVKWDDATRGRRSSGCFMLADEMGLGKTRQVIEAARFLAQANDINTVVVVAPAAVRSVWFDPDLGELKRYHEGTSFTITEFHTRMREWKINENQTAPLKWIIANYDFIRRAEHFTNLANYLKGKRTLLVLDESSAVKSHKTEQTKACIKLRKLCRRVWLLNGTPIAHSPADLYSQAYIMDPAILGCSSFFQYRSRYAVMGGWQQKQIIGWYHPFIGSAEKCTMCGTPRNSTLHCLVGEGLDEIKRRLAPYILRREKIDCLDLPEKLPSVTLTVTLSSASWKIYKELRDEMIAWLDSATSAMAAQAGVRAMRLAQVTSGFVGGLKIQGKCECNMNPKCMLCGGSGIEVKEIEPRTIGDEKQKFVEGFLVEQFALGEKVLVWCRFRSEVARIERSLPLGIPRGLIWGGQTPADREIALRLLDPRTAPAGPTVVIGTPASGSMGLNLTAAATVIYVSNDYSLKTRLQSEDRVHRPGQTRAVSYFDIVAVGPKGEKTIDHFIVKARRDKADLATWTISAWKEALTQ